MVERDAYYYLAINNEKNNNKNHNIIYDLIMI